MKLEQGKPLLLLRADADDRIGAGHLMRCLALAQAWCEQGGQAVFAGRLSAPGLAQRLRQEGYPFVGLAKSHPDPQDRERMAEVLASCGGIRGWVAVDGYHFDLEYQAFLRATGWRVLVIDDAVGSVGHEADILLNQNVYAKGGSAAGDASEGIGLFGPRFALLRREFLQRELNRRQESAQARRILVTMGGADPGNATRHVLQVLALAGGATTDLDVKAVLGPANPHRPQLEKAVQDLPLTLELLEPTEDMASLMVWADLAVTGAGTTCLELAYLGIPFAAVVLAENQEPVAVGFAARHAAVPLGRPADWEVARIGEILGRLLGSPSERQVLARNAQKLVDGLGSSRVVRAMLSFDFRLRSAGMDDCQTVFQWANDPEIRGGSFHSRAIGWQEHLQWFTEKLQDPAHFFYLAETSAGEPMGQARFALKGREAVISAALAAPFRGLGLGGRFLVQACRLFFQETACSAIRALIKEENHRSRRVFAKAGFRAAGETVVAGCAAVTMVLQRKVPS